jgi:hypothetical protein
MRSKRGRMLFSQPVKNAMKANKTKEFDLRQANSVLYQLSRNNRLIAAEPKRKQHCDT